MMRIFTFIFGLLLVAGIIYSGYYTITNSNFIVWFGIITAIVSPFAFECLITPFKSKDKKIMKELSKVPQIEQLIQNAKDNESKITLLEKQIRELDKLISYESQKKTLEAKRAIYILQGKESLSKINEINENLELLTETKQSLPDELKSLMKVIEEIESTDVIYQIRGKRLIFKQKYFSWFPFYGNLLFEIIRDGKRIMNKIDKK
jgi:hypothetical protein